MSEQAKKRRLREHRNIVSMWYIFANRVINLRVKRGRYAIERKENEMDRPRRYKREKSM